MALSIGAPSFAGLQTIMAKERNIFTL